MTFSRIDGPADAPVVVLSNSLGTTLAMWDPQSAGADGALQRAALRPSGTRPGAARARRVGRGARHAASSRSSTGTGSSASRSAVSRSAAPSGSGSRSTRPSGSIVSCWPAGRPASARRESWRARARRCGRAASRRSPTPCSRCWFTPETRRERAGARARLPRDDGLGRAREGYAGCCEALARWDPGDELSRITAPTLVIAGSEDPATPPARPRRSAAAIPGARLRVLQGAGHLANIEQPDAFSRLLVDHLTARPATEVRMSSPSDDAYERGMRDPPRGARRRARRRARSSARPTSPRTSRS